MNDNTNIRLNNVDYQLSAAISSPDSTGVILTPMQLFNVTIHDNIFEPFFSASIEYFDDEHFVEQGKTAAGPVENQQNSTNIGYRFNGDGLDVVDISFKLISDDVDINCNCKCSVVDTSRSYNSNTQRFTKTLFLTDFYKQLFKNIQSFFTTTNITNKYISQCSNNSRTMLTGDAIKKLLISNGVEESSINIWDNGNNNIFYSSSSNEKVYDTLLNLYKLHISADSQVNGLCYLSHEFTDNTWNLVDLSLIYKNAVDKSNIALPGVGVLYAGNINIETSGGDIQTRTLNTRLPINALSLNDSMALSYDFKDMNADDAVNINTHIVYNYDNANKEFTIDMCDGNIDMFSNFFTNNYISHMIGNKNSPYINLHKLDFKSNNQSFTNIYNNYLNTNKAFGQNTLTQLFNILNNAIELTIYGNLNYKSGKFISINSNNAIKNNTFSDKIYGMYLIISATHIINNGKFTTKLVCVKPYLYQKPSNS